jgi:drug/metabolite transporter (DMT)-like permease
MRWWIALVLLLPLGWRVLRSTADITSRWKHFALLGLVGVGSYNALQYRVRSTPLNVTLIAASMPVGMMPSACSSTACGRARGRSPARCSR